VLNTKEDWNHEGGKKRKRSLRNFESGRKERGSLAEG